ncbi:hypothetical protein DFAR_3070005 [Desulfarculales bacterium]
MHAKRLFKFLAGGKMEMVAAVTAGVIGTHPGGLEGFRGR